MLLLKSVTVGFIRRSRHPLARSCYISSQLRTRRYPCERELSMDTPNQVTKGCSSSDVVSALNKIAPLHLAEGWDNVGLLVSPTDPQRIATIFLTNDLTEPVLDEAISLNANFIVSYHPPIFVPLKSLTTATFKERVILKAIEARIAVYSPHTALDAVGGGVNDWLAAGVGEGKVKPLSLIETEPHHSKTILIQGFGSEGEARNCLEKISSEIDQMKLSDLQVVQQPEGIWQVTLDCDKKTVLDILSLTTSKPELSVEMKSAVSTKTNVGNPVASGCGRLLTLNSALSLLDVVERVKKHLQLRHIRVANGNNATMDTNVKTVAICAGSGSSVLKNIGADVLLTGEMSHHAVLEANAQGSTVILCEHSNTERGYLKILKESLHTHLSNSKVDIVISQVDKDPLQTL